MTRAEIEEEIRAQLREAQVNTVETPWTYTSDDFTPQIRSALRHLTMIWPVSASIVGAMDVDGTFTTDPTAIEGLLISLFVAHRLVSGDLVQKLGDGELGVIFKTGSDYMDTTEAARSFEKAAANLKLEYDAKLVIALSNLDSGVNNVLGLQKFVNDQGV